MAKIDYLIEQVKNSPNPETLKTVLNNASSTIFLSYRQVLMTQLQTYIKKLNEATSEAEKEEYSLKIQQTLANLKQQTSEENTNSNPTTTDMNKIKSEIEELLNDGNLKEAGEKLLLLAQNPDIANAIISELYKEYGQQLINAIEEVAQEKENEIAKLLSSINSQLQKEIMDEIKKNNKQLADKLSKRIESLAKLAISKEKSQIEAQIAKSVSNLEAISPEEAEQINETVTELVNLYHPDNTGLSPEEYQNLRNTLASLSPTTYKQNKTRYFKKVLQLNPTQLQALLNTLYQENKEVWAQLVKDIYNYHSLTILLWLEY
jgi:DNA polymerase III alpha subunit (gram-positive type)